MYTRPARPGGHMWIGEAPLNPHVDHEGFLSLLVQYKFSLGKMKMLGIYYKA